jgi:DNA topoisomerase-1
MEAYCLKCKTKRDLVDPQPVFFSNGTAATRGTCPVCGSALNKMGRTEAHEGMPKPEPKPAAPRRKRGNGAGAAPGGNGRRAGKLVIVESPAKAKTVGRFLGKGFTVRASVGHVRDLLRSQLSVDVANGFTPKYRVPNEKRPVVKELRDMAAKAERIFLATDPDREGEAIAWHLVEAAELDPAATRRVVFHEITESAIHEAFGHPREIDMNLVNAQQTRRILDRLVGYSLSPLLWAKVRSRLSAGRVQSVALRLVVEREREILAFVPQEYWTVEAELVRDAQTGKQFRARLARVDDKEPSLASREAVDPLLKDLDRAAYRVARVKRGERRRNPSAPFTTSTLQQEASRRLGYAPKRTMAIAQQLYEGIELGEQGSVGLITYMRTDSMQVAASAQEEAREYISQRFGGEMLPAQTPQYRTRSRNAQEAHEAIRPTAVRHDPQSLQEYLSREQMRLYTLIWQRFVASQMAPAVYDTLTIEIEAQAEHQYLLRASGATLRFRGYQMVYEEVRDEDVNGDQEAEFPNLPSLEEGDLLRLLQLLPEQHFTMPPPRFTEAALVKALEENGIGRPSTYAPILSTIQARGYVTKEEKRLVPTDTGMTVNDLLVEHFPEVMDLGFTAQMEDRLDMIADGEADWVQSLREFYVPFSARVSAAEAEMPVVNGGPEPAGRDCPQCGKPLVIRWGRYGKFIGCSNFPTCRYIEPWLEKIGVRCPKDGGEIVERKTRKGRTFYGCANYPACDFTSWKRPLAQPCPACGGLLVQANRQTAQCTKCGTEVRLEELHQIAPEG